MEAVEEHSLLNNVEGVKSNVVQENRTSCENSNESYKANGVDSDTRIDGGQSDEKSVPVETVSTEDITDKSEIECAESMTVNTDVKTATELTCTDADNLLTVADEPNMEIETKIQYEEKTSQDMGVSVEVVTETVIETEEEVCFEGAIIKESTIEMESATTNEQVHFETEILVEKNDNDDSDVNENVLSHNEENDPSNNILNELGPNIELNEVLRSSDVTENIENNNSSLKQEVFNKEELLDILEGNDAGQPENDTTSPILQSKISEAQIAMQQLSRLKKTRKKRVERFPRTKKGDKNLSPNKDFSHMETESNLDKTKRDEKSVNENLSNESEINLDKVKLHQNPLDIKHEDAQSDNIINALVMDWDDEPAEDNQTDINKEGEIILQESRDFEDTEQHVVLQDVMDCTVTDFKNEVSESQIKSNKSDNDGPTRRISRVIKKKVIFDPDNPDTFTKGKSIKTKEVHVTKEQSTSKKGKIEQISPRSKSKSPLLKLQWKKPSTKNSKQCKRLSEVDKLLMDEGAVNMIYQLTPEAPKGKKNVKTKAEFIKKIQSSTPETKEMKFRERKKESVKQEEGEAKRILGGKHRISLSSSVKSPAISDDFETHSADDSIIYRRHSSSSYSSSCMSPRRLSDVDSGGLQNINRHMPNADSQIESKTISNVESESPQDKNIFNKSTTSNILSSDMINKDDCLSIKEKLNSKLSLALKKRKRETSKNEKPLKQKKLVKTEEIETSEKEDKAINFKFISVSFDQRLALICIQKTGIKICVEVLKELDEALNYIDNRKDISITLLASQCGTLCSNLDLSLLLDENKEINPNHAYDLAESVRSLLSSLVRHSKLVCCGVWGACAGVALALVALSDLALASEGASFALAAAAAPSLPGAAALSARCRPLVNDLVIFGRRLSASEALQGGLVSRILWPDRFDEQVYNIAKDIAAQPLQTVLLKKRLLSLKNNSDSELTFLSCLETERDLLVEYWTSVEGQELLRATLDAA